MSRLNPQSGCSDDWHCPGYKLGAGQDRMKLNVETTAAMGKNMSDLKKIRLVFWQQFMSKSKGQQILYEFKPTESMMMKHYLSVTTCGLNPVFHRGVHFSYVCNPKNHFVELTIQESKEYSKRLFETFYKNMPKIEILYGEKLRWDGPKLGRDRTKIMSCEYQFGHNDIDKYSMVISNLFSKMNKLKKALGI